MTMFSYPVEWWKAPIGETIIGIIAYQDMIIVSTNRTIYVVKSEGKGLDSHEISAVMHQQNQR